MAIVLNWQTPVAAVLERRRSGSWPAVVAWLALLSFAVGCKDLIPPRPPIGSPATTSGEASSADQKRENESDLAGGAESQAETYEGDWSEWYVHRFGSQVVGVTEIGAVSTIDQAQRIAAATEVDYFRRERLVFRSGSTSFIRRIEVTSVESVDGSLKSFASDVVSGPVSSQTRGTLSATKLSINTVRGREQSSRQLDWSSNTRGLFVLEQTLRRRIMTQGETRRLSVLMPSLESIGLIELRCTGEASVPMFDGSYRLLREIEVVTYLDGNPIDSMVVWVNDRGGIEKSLRPDLRLESFRSDRATADAMFARRDDSQVRVRVAGSLRDDAEATQVAYLIVGPGPPASQRDPGDVSDGNVSGLNAKEDQGIAGGLFPAVATQSVRRSDEGLQVLVSSELQKPAGFQSDGSTPEPSDTSATLMIDFGQSAVARMAAAIGELSGRELADELSHLVVNDLSLVPQGRLRPASAVIRSGQGGVVDHAVVLAALLRARKFPARVVFGLSRDRDPDLAGDDRVIMTLAAWVVVSIDGQWVAIDPMTAQFNRADQLCLSRPGPDVDLQESLSSVFEQLAKIQIEIRGATYAASSSGQER